MVVHACEANTQNTEAIVSKGSGSASAAQQGPTKNLAGLRCGAVSAAQCYDGVA